MIGARPIATGRRDANPASGCTRVTATVAPAGSLTTDRVPATLFARPASRSSPRSSPFSCSRPETSSKTPGRRPRIRGAPSSPGTGLVSCARRITKTGCDEEKDESRQPRCREARASRRGTTARTGGSAAGARRSRREPSPGRSRARPTRSCRAPNRSGSTAGRRRDLGRPAGAPRDSSRGSAGGGGSIRRGLCLPDSETSGGSSFRIAVRVSGAVGREKARRPVSIS